MVYSRPWDPFWPHGGRPGDDNVPKPRRPVRHLLMGEIRAGRGRRARSAWDSRGRSIIMRIPQVTDRKRHGPGQALRAVFTGIGQMFLAADRLKEQVDSSADADSRGGSGRGWSHEGSRGGSGGRGYGSGGRGGGAGGRGGGAGGRGGGAGGPGGRGG